MSLALRQLYGRLEAGTIAVTPKDAVALLRLAHETERERAPGHSDEAWQASVRQLL